MSRDNGTKLDRLGVRFPRRARLTGNNRPSIQYVAKEKSALCGPSRRKVRFAEPPWFESQSDKLAKRGGFAHGWYRIHCTVYRIARKSESPRLKSRPRAALSKCLPASPALSNNDGRAWPFRRLAVLVLLRLFWPHQKGFTRERAQ